ncbi:MAG: glycosyltransferase family 2 protein [Candidatus Coatesbacteria bacterium]|nr:glycosyltransferase family 2 protein [Candidatus Coatesbacteria bacterium]
MHGPVKNVAFVVVTFNSAREIAGCLDSIAAQGLHEFRIVVVDNGSWDETVRTVQESGIDLTLVRNETNRGFAAACNQAASMTDDGFIMFLNPDARLCPGAVEKLASAIESDERIGIAGPRLTSPDGTLLPSAYRSPTVFQELAFLFHLRPILVSRPFRRLFGRLLAGRFAQFDPHDTRRVVDTVIGACMLVRREVFLNVGGFDEQFFLFYEEKDFCKRALEAGFLTLFVPEAEAVHEVGASVKSDPLAAASAKRASMKRYYRKHKPMSANVVLQAALMITAPAHIVKQKIESWRKSRAAKGPRS